MQSVSLSTPQAPDYDDIEAEIDKELEEDEKLQEIKRMPKSHKKEKRGNKTEELEEDEERWPSPMEPLDYDSDRDSPSKSSTLVPPPPEVDDQTDEEKKYILEKIQQANQELQDQEAPDLTRRRRLHFKDKLVDLVVPPLQFEKNGSSGEVDGGKGSKARVRDSEAEPEVSGKLSELKLSPREECAGSGFGGSGRAGERSEGGLGLKEGRVLVEKDGKFDLVSLNELESQGLLPSIANNISDYSRSSPRPQEQTASSSKIHRSSSSSHPRAGSSHFQQGVDHLRVPRPPAQPRSRPSSASHSQRRSQRNNGIKRRVQSATGTTYQATHTLSPQQKELLERVQERKEKLAREVGKMCYSWSDSGQEKVLNCHTHALYFTSVHSCFPCQAEQRKHEEDEQRRQDNELAFKAWLMKKREQFQEEKRIHRAQEMEKMNSKV